MSLSDYRSQLLSNWEDRRGLLSGRAPVSISTAPVTPLAVGPHRQLRQELFERLLIDVEEYGSDDTQIEPAIRRRVRRVIERAIKEEHAPALTQAEREELENELVAEATGQGPLASLFADATVSDILVNGPNDVFIDRFGRLEKTAVRFDSDAHLLHVIGRLVSSRGRHVDEASPSVDVRLADGSRLHAIIPPLSRWPVLCIRRARSIPFSIGQLCAADTLNRAMAILLERYVKAGANIVISGGVGSGKTTLLSVLAGFIPMDARIVTIEETAELILPHAHVVSLEARLPNIEGHGEVTQRALVRNALRMRADRLIVGEVRGPEVFDMLQAMNTGHEGSLTTVHANSSSDALRRLESLVLLAGFPLPSHAIRELLSATIHLIVQLTRFGDGTRRIVRIDEMGPLGDTLETVPIYKYERGHHQATGAPSRFLAGRHE